MMFCDGYCGYCSNSECPMAWHSSMPQEEKKEEKENKRND